MRVRVAALGLISAMLLATVSCSNMPSLGAEVSSNRCKSAEGLNAAFNQMLLDAGAGYSAGDLMNPQKGPFLLADNDSLAPESLRRLLPEACVYALQQNAPGFEDSKVGWFVVSKSAVDVSKVKEAVQGCPLPFELVEDYTDVMQGNPEIVGGFVEDFSLRLMDWFPDTEYAAMFPIC